MTEQGPIVIERLQDAMNRHDLEALVACFVPDFQSEQPNHPQRAFRGNEQVRKNWSAIFERMPDFAATVLRSCQEGDALWSEWHWSGTLADGAHKELRGVIIFGTRDDQLSSARLYMEYTAADDEDFDTSIGRMTQGS